MADIDTSSLPAGVSLVEGRGGLPALRVNTPACTGEVYLHGAHVTEWAPAGSEQVLWLSEKSEFSAAKPIRGGVPICAPWFGPGKKGDLAPAHGWFRASAWSLASSSASGDAVTLTFCLDGADADVPEGASRGVRAEYSVSFGSALGLELTVTSDDALDLENALHAYLAVSDITQVTVEGLDGSRYVDKAPGGRAVNAQQGALKFLRETDRVYAHEGTTSVIDPGAGRRIVIDKEGSASTVVWNPWTTKSAAMPDFGDDEWTGMVCVEAANALAKSVRLEPGASHTMKATYSVAPL